MLPQRYRPPHRQISSKLHSFNEWVKLHTTNLHQASYGAICRPQPTDSVDGFDFSAHYPWFYLSLRPDSDGNPTKAYRIEDAELRPSEELWDPRTGGGELKEGVRQSLGDFETKYLANRDVSRRIVGTLVDYFIPEVPMHILGAYNLHDDREFVQMMSMTCIDRIKVISHLKHELWLQNLRERVELGYMFGPEKDFHKKISSGLGELRRTTAGSKTKWTCVALTGVEAKRRGCRIEDGFCG